MTLHLCDANVWLGLTIDNHLHHDVSQTWLESVQEAESILFCRSTQQTFLRLLTTRAVLSLYGRAPLSNVEAWTAYDALLADSRIVLQANDPSGMEVHWRQYATRSSASPKLCMDAYLAAFARASGCSLVTTDTAFRQFPGLDLLILEQSKPF
jgi:uncharacterized protein